MHRTVIRILVILTILILSTWVALPAQTKINLATQVRGILATVNGGTGADTSTYTAGRYLRANGTGGFNQSSVAAGGAGGCTNQVVTQTNDNATPSCNTVVKSMVSSTFVHNDQANTYSTGLQDFSSASLKLPTGTPTAAGALGYDDAQKVFLAYSGSTSTARPLVRAAPCTPQFSTSDTLDAAVIGTTETSFSTTCTVPANFFIANKVIRVSVGWQYTTSAGSAPTIQLRMKIGGTNVWAPAACCGTLSLTNHGFGQQFYVQGTAAPGASVLVMTHGISSVASAFSSIGHNTIAQNGLTFATNGALAITFSAQYSAGTSGNTITMMQMVIEEIN